MDSSLKRRKGTASNTSDSKPESPSSSTSNSGFLSFRTLVLVLLPLFSIAGAYGTYGLAFNNGCFAILTALDHQDAPLLPGTNDPILMSYTGIEAIDRQLIILVVFFSPVVDIKNGALWLFSIFGLGQFGAAWAIMMMEGLRLGNKGKIISFVGFFGFIFQNITFTITVPIWLFLHVLTSPVAKSNSGSKISSALYISSFDLKILPVTLVLGYIIPSILMGIPSGSTVSSVLHQQFIALWQPFPIWCVIIQTSLRSIFSTSSGDVSKNGTALRSSAKSVYIFNLGFCIYTHLPALLLSIIPPSTIPDSLPVLQQLATHSFSSIYIPYFPSLEHQVSDFMAGVHNFLQWDLYVGTTAMLLWGILLHRNAKRDASLTSPGKEDGGYLVGLVGKVVFWTVLAGPCGALTVLLWDRDSIVNRKVKGGS